MANTTIEAVKLMVGDDFIFDNEIGDDQIEVMIADANLQVDIDGVPTPYKERAVRLYSCHLITMIVQSRNSSVEGVTSEKVGPMQTSYAHYSGNDKYGNRYEEEYQKLLQQLGLGGNVGRFM